VDFVSRPRGSEGFKCRVTGLDVGYWGLFSRSRDEDRTGGEEYFYEGMEDGARRRLPTEVCRVGITIATLRYLLTLKGVLRILLRDPCSNVHVVIKAVSN
jgi:hypothetical protein